MKIKFEIEGKPFGQQRPLGTVAYKWIGRYRKPYVKMIDRPESVAYKLMVSAIGKSIYKDKPLKQVPLAVYITSFYEIPKSYSKKKKQACLRHEEWPMKKPDVDNIEKGILDGLNKVIYHDDAQVVETYNIKAFSNRPRVEVEIKTLDEPLRKLVDDESN